jgi:hypothetical protein
MDMEADPFRGLATFIATSFRVGMLTAHLIAKRPSCPRLRHTGWIALAGLLMLAVLLLSRFVIDYLESLLLAPVFVLVVYGNDFGGLLRAAPSLTWEPSATACTCCTASCYLLHPGLRAGGTILPPFLQWPIGLLSAAKACL